MLWAGDLFVLWGGMEHLVAFEDESPVAEVAPGGDLGSEAQRADKALPLRPGREREATHPSKFEGISESVVS